MVSKKLFLIGVIALVGLVGVAIAAAVKVDLLPMAAPSDPDSGAYGKAVLNYSKDDNVTEVQINCGGLTPGGTYEPGLFGYGGFPYVTALPSGKITVHAEIPGDVSGLDPGVFRISPGPFVLVLRAP